MKNKFIFLKRIQTSLLLFLFVALIGNTSALGQITMVTAGNCHDVEPYIYNVIGVDATGRNQFQKTTNDGTYIAYNAAGGYWAVTTDLGFAFNYNENTEDSTPNPPSLSLGTWTTAAGLGQCAITSLTGDVQDQVVLPVSLAHFKGHNLKKTILLEWQTSTELNNDYMAIERSADGKQFQEIGRVNGAGTTNTPQQYSFTDRAPFLGANYYRLRQVDYDGKTTFHDVITVNYQIEDIKIRLTPNPTTDQMVVQLAQVAEKSLDIVLYNMYGQSILNYSLSAGQSQFELDLSRLASGQYILELSDAGQILFVLERIAKN